MKIYELLELAKYGCTCCPTATEYTYHELEELNKRFVLISTCDISDLQVTVSWEILKDVLEKVFEIPIR